MQVLGVPPTANQIAYWTDQVTRGIITQSNLAYAIARVYTTQEFSVSSGTVSTDLSTSSPAKTATQVFVGKDIPAVYGLQDTFTPLSDGFKAISLAFMVGSTNNSFNSFLLDTEKRSDSYNKKHPNGLGAITLPLQPKTYGVFLSNTGLWYVGAYKLGATKLPSATDQGYLIVPKIKTSLPQELSFNIWSGTFGSIGATITQGTLSEASASLVKVVLGQTPLSRFLDTTLNILSVMDSVSSAAFKLANAGSQTPVKLSFDTYASFKTTKTVSLVDYMNDTDTGRLAAQKGAEAYERAQAYVRSYNSTVKIQALGGLYFKHNWTTNLIERIEYRTDVITSRLGHEQRRSLRRNPRTSFEMVFTVNKDRLQFISNFLLRFQSAMTEIPMQHRASKIKSVLGSVLEISTPVNVNDTVLFGFDTYAPVLGVVKTVSQQGLSFFITVSVDNGFIPLKGITCTPVKSGRVRASSIRHINSEVANVSVGVELTDSIPKRTVNIQTISSTNIGFQDAPLFDLVANFATEPVFSFEKRVNEVDFGNVNKVYDLEVLARKKLQYQFLVNLEKADLNILDIFHYARGRAKRFYMTSNTNDLIMHPDFNVVTGSKNMYLKPCGLGDLSNLSWNKLVRIYLRNGKRITATVIRVEPLGGSKELAIFKEAFNFSFSSLDVRMISVIDLCRFSSDLLEVSWITTSLASVTTQIEVING
jgi:phage-related protein